MELKSRYKILIEMCKNNKLVNDENLKELNYLITNQNNMINHL